MHLLPRPRPVDARLVLVDLVRIGDAGSGCGVSVSEPRSSAPSARTIRSAPRRASRSCRSPAVASGAIGTRSAIATGPVSSPSSIFMTITPVSASPAMIARLIGAAPRQRGSSEACRLKRRAATLRGSAPAGSAHRRRRPPRRRRGCAQRVSASAAAQRRRREHGKAEAARLALDRARRRAPCRAARPAWARACRPPRPRGRGRRSRPASAPRSPACP